MAQFYTSFNDSPALTEEWHTGDGSFSIETTGLPTGTSDGAALRVVQSTRDRYAISWDAVGTPTGDVQFRMRWQVDAASVTFQDSARANICGGGNSTAEDAYFAGHTVTGSAQTQSLVGYNAGSGGVLGNNTQTLSVDTWYQTFIEKTGTTIRYWTWDESGSEPISWDVSVTDATHSGGWVGPGHFHSSQTLWVDWMSAGTGGDAAPTERPGPSPASDTDQIGAIESASIVSSLARSDSSQVGGSELVSSLASVSLTDVGQVSSVESVAMGIGASDSDVLGVSEIADLVIFDSISGSDTDQIGAVESTSFVILISGSDSGAVGEAEVSALDIIDIYLLLPTYLRIIQDGYTLAMQDDSYSMTMIEDGLSITIVEE